MSIKAQLELARQELLDMGLRGNPMLHVPRNSKFLEIMEGDTSFVFQTLTAERKAFGFRGLAEDGEGMNRTISKARFCPKRGMKRKLPWTSPGKP